MAVCAVTFPVVLPFYLLLSFVVVAFEGSDRYVEAAAVTIVAALVLAYVDRHHRRGRKARVHPDR